MSKLKLYEVVIPGCPDEAAAQSCFAGTLHKRGLRAVDTPVIAWQPRLFSTQQDAVVRAHVQSIQSL